MKKFLLLFVLFCVIGKAQLTKPHASGGAVACSSCNFSDFGGSLDSTQIPSLLLSSTKLQAGIPATKIANGTVSSVEFQTLDGVTSAIQAQLDGKVPKGDSATGIRYVTLKRLNDSLAAHGGGGG